MESLRTNLTSKLKLSVILFSAINQYNIKIYAKKNIDNKNILSNLKFYFSISKKIDTNTDIKRSNIILVYYVYFKFLKSKNIIIMLILQMIIYKRKD